MAPRARAQVLAAAMRVLLALKAQQEEIEAGGGSEEGGSGESGASGGRSGRCCSGRSGRSGRSTAVRDALLGAGALEVGRSEAKAWLLEGQGPLLSPAALAPPHKQARAAGAGWGCCGGSARQRAVLASEGKAERAGGQAPAGQGSS